MSSWSFAARALAAGVLCATCVHVCDARLSQQYRGNAQHSNAVTTAWAVEPKPRVFKIDVGRAQTGSFNSLVLNGTLLVTFTGEHFQFNLVVVDISSSTTVLNESLPKYIWGVGLAATPNENFVLALLCTGGIIRIDLTAMPFAARTLCAFEYCRDNGTSEQFIHYYPPTLSDDGERLYLAPKDMDYIAPLLEVDARTGAVVNQLSVKNFIGEHHGLLPAVDAKGASFWYLPMACPYVLNSSFDWQPDVAVPQLRDNKYEDIILGLSSKAVLSSDGALFVVPSIADFSMDFYPFYDGRPINVAYALVKTAALVRNDNRSLLQPFAAVLGGCGCSSHSSPPAISARVLCVIGPERQTYLGLKNNQLSWYVMPSSVFQPS